MLRRRYVLCKVLPTVFLLCVGLLCTKNLIAGLRKNNLELVQTEFSPENPQINQETLGKTQNYVVTVKKFDDRTIVNNNIKLENKAETKKLTDAQVNSSLLPKKPCENQKCNFVFIKPMKCATETVVRILRKYSYENDLNIMLPRQKRLYLAWPYLMDDSDYRLSDRPFNGLIDHAIYNKTIMNRYFPPQTTHYVTIIREPLKQFKSAFNYFKIAQISGIFTLNPLTEFLENIENYESIYKSPEAATYRYCIPNGFSVTKNLLAHCLGMPIGFPKDRENISNNLHAVQDYIENLDKDFSLVMLVEYFHESLVLFKRLMNWQLKDMIYKSVNRGTYFYAMNSHYKAKHRQWSAIDYMLYDHFNQTLWKKIAAEGPEFYDEVYLFNNIQRHVNTYCWGLDKNVESDLNITASPFNPHFTVTKEDCKMMDISWLDKIKEK